MKIIEKKILHPSLQCETLFSKIRIAKKGRENRAFGPASLDV
jgi:hypothetical protein